MPTYLNSTANVITIGSLRIEPGQTAASDVWIPTLPAGVTKTLDTPFYNPVILSAVYLTSQTVDVPVTAVSNYKISIYATGELTVKFNSADATAYLVPEGSVLEKLCTSRIINDIRLTIEEDRAAYIHIEKAQ